MTTSYQLESFSGPWSAATRQHAALRFLEAYTANIRARGFSAHAGQWYAPSSVFYNCDGREVRGGKAIWRWTGDEVFARFESIDSVEDATRTRLIHHAAPAYYEDVHLRESAPQSADVVTFEHVLVLHLKGDAAAGHAPIKVRRMMEFIIGPGEGGDGFDGLQIWQGKVCWDTAVVKEEARRRQSSARGDQ